MIERAQSVSRTASRTAELIRVESFSVVFDGQRIVSDFSATFGPGERVALLGPSGCGKSTIALCLNGIIPHRIEAETTGSIELAAVPMSRLEPGEISRRVGVVFQDPDAQFCMITPEDEIAFGLEIAGFDRPAMISRVDAIVEEFGLGPFRRERIDRLSGGMKQRVATAAVLALEPDVLILDEATASLDRPAAEALARAIIARLERKPATALIVIEHELDPFLPILTRVIAMSRDGAIETDTTPDAFFSAITRLPAPSISIPHSVDLVSRVDRASGRSEIVDAKNARQTALRLARDSASAVDVLEVTRPGSPRNPESRSSTTPVIAFRSVSVTHGGPRTVHALDDVTLDFHRNSIVALTGSNGAGKTTVALAALAIVRPTSGQIEVNGRSTARLRPAEIGDRVGLVFQNPEYQFVTSRVRDEIAYGPRLARVLTEAEIAARVNRLLEQFGLTNRADVSPFALSHGEKRRLSVATMLIRGCDAVFLDEPTLGQDASSRREIADEIVRLRGDGVAVIVITHDLDLVWRIADTVVVLDRGRVVAEGSPGTVYGSRGVVESNSAVQPPDIAVWYAEARRALDLPA